MSDRVGTIVFICWMIALALLFSPFIIFLVALPLFMNPYFLVGGAAGILAFIFLL